ncbi:hypothetical protein O3G_MSEX008148 [Manduca sexta]|nr:hypothetical protein O3G_MSEX008148 [Manduca sexta]
MDRSLIPLVACPMFVFNKTTFSRTITSDWDLVCSKHWLTHLTQCVMMWGIVIGGIIFGVLADKYGRKTPLMISVLIQGVASYVASFMPDYWSFLAVWFILALGSGGVGIISFVICMEVVSGKYRTTVPVLYQLPFGLGNAIMAGLAYWLRDWRKLEFTLATLSSLFIFYWFWIPESPRWLLATGQIEKAMVVLKEAAQQNGKCYTMRQLKQLMPKVKSQKRREPGFLAFFRSRNMRLKTFLLSINWFFTGLAFYTFSQYLGSIGGDIFVAVSWTGIISTLGAITCVFIVTKMGRKTTVGIYQLITAICFIMLLVVPKDSFANNWPRLLFAGIGFAGMAVSRSRVKLNSSEFSLYS